MARVTIDIDPSDMDNAEMKELLEELLLAMAVEDVAEALVTTDFDLSEITKTKEG